jgi:predicted MFS family arabinose efflux permease
MRLSRPLLLIYVAGFLRSLGVGLLGVILGVYLSRVGVSATRIGLVIGAGLLGACAATAVVAWAGARIGYRTSLVTLSLLAAVGGLALATLPSFPILLLLIFIGMVNGMGTDRSAAFALEQAIIPGLVADRSRTWALSWYNVLLDGGGALGALGAVLPLAVSVGMRVDLVAAYRYIFAGYALLHAGVAALYLLLPAQNELLHSEQPAGAEPVVSPQSKKTIHHIAALFAMDAFGGGFLTDALVSYWFFQRFGIAEQRLALLFFAVHVLNALSHLGAAWLAHRIGLVNTMVFTHLPSSLFLIAVPFASGPKLAVALFLLRESFVEMDVPTRQSYVAALVKPQERPYASGITNITRTGAWAAAAALSGMVMQRLAFSAPLVIGGTLKIAYDLLLYRNFRHLKPPEEQVATSPRTPAAIS